MVVGVVGLFLFINKKEKGEFARKIEHSNLKIGYITDLHCYSKLDKDKNSWEVNWRCSQPMANFIQMMNEDFKPDVVVEGGDLVDGRDGQEKNVYPVALDLFKKINAPAYHILGNHETRGFSKEHWLDLTNYEETYYFRDIEDHRLIFLDGNYKPTVGHTSPERKYYPGYLEENQMKWLEETLKTSADKNILVFVHQPPVERTILKNKGELFIEGEKLRKLFSQYRVNAVFSGHIEEMCYFEEDGVDYYVLEGVHKNNDRLLKKDDYKDQGVFYQILVDENQEVLVKMFYKDKEAQDYQTLIVNQETAICNSESINNREAYGALVEQENGGITENEGDENEETGNFEEEYQED
jgi:3',5'-cyclic AMP phosphodiesterase CpdA